MIILIAGASHTGKTALAQKLLEKYHFPYISIDHIKMGLIRSGQTLLTPMSSQEELTEYLWPILKEIIKTCIENKQNLIVEGCYIPFDWKKHFSSDEQKEIQAFCLVMSEHYILNHFDDIKQYANVIEQRLDDTYFTLEHALAENQFFHQHATDFKTIVIDQYQDIEKILDEDLYFCSARPIPSSTSANF